MVISMKFAVMNAALCAIALVLSSCGSGSKGGSTASQPSYSGTGPFDRNGNYVEEWADNPLKWRLGGISTPGRSTPARSMPARSTPVDDEPVIVRLDEPPADAVPLAPTRSVSTPTADRSETRAPGAAKAKAQVKPSSTAAVKPKPKPKPAVAKAKAKAATKPKSVTYVVKKGDSLSAIASKTGASVSAIKAANKISGSIIRPGQALTIPKK